MPNALGDFFSKLFSKNDGQSVLGLDIGSSAIKAVQIKKKKGKAVLETYGELSLGPYAGVEVGRATRIDNATLIQAINDLFSIKEVNITTRITGMAIPMRASMVSVLTFPTSDEKKLAEMVPLEARKYIPVPISEVAFDWSVIPNAFSGEDANEKDSAKNKQAPFKTEVLVVAIHNDTLSAYAELTTKTGLQNTFYEIEMFGAMRALLDQSQIAPALVIDFGSATTKIYIVEAGIVRESHVINRGFQDITLNISTSLSVPIDLAEQLKRNYGSNKAEDDKHVGDVATLVLDALFSEINTVMVSYQRKHAKNIGLVYLTGGGASMKGMAEKSLQHLSIKTEIGNSFSKVQVPAFLQEVLKATGTGFSVAVGVALRKLQELG